MSLSVQWDFNPRSLAGATIVVLLILSRHQKFQSTLPRGSDMQEREQAREAARISIHAPSRERPILLPADSFDFYFNPRSLAGATYMVRITTGFTSISIHAPSRERLPLRPTDGENPCISIHAPSRERPLRGQLTDYMDNFNPRSLAGATPSPPEYAPNLLYFNPRSLAGATLRSTGLDYGDAISIHAPSRERP